MSATPIPFPARSSHAAGAADEARRRELACLRALERKVLWLSSWTIHNANHLRQSRDGLKVGGHQASSASLVTLMTALYFQILRPQDRVAVKPHASPVFHAIQYLLDHQSVEKMQNFRGFGGVQSYPSRTKDKADVDFSTGSVGLGVAATGFASLVQDYIHAKSWRTSTWPKGRMIALMGDAEIDEGNIHEALLEYWKHGLKNCWWVVDYNRQSLDSVVSDRLFMKVAGLFENLGWKVMLIKYGKLQEAAFREPGGERLRTWIADCPNQLYSALVFEGASGWRRQLEADFAGDADILGLIGRRSDDELARLMTNLGGHDMESILEAFAAAPADQPVCFIAYTIKGFGLPLAGHKDNHAGLMNKTQMQAFRAQHDTLSSITRVGPDGRILYTYPDEQSVGRSVLQQPHVQQVLATRRPVVSQVFTSVQGFQTVALHVPVSDGAQPAGSLAALVPFDAIARRYLEGVRLGESGHALLLSQDGVELYCAVPGHGRRSVFETSAAYPDSLAMARRMLSGESGTASYRYPDARGPGGAEVTKHAFFTPIPLENTFWSVAVAAAESEALVFIQGFRNRLAIGFALSFVAFIAWGALLARAYLRLGREEARQLAQERVLAAERQRERALRESEERFRSYFEDSLLAMAITSPARGWVVVNDRLVDLLGYSREELRGLDWAQLTHPEDLAADEAQYARMLAGDIEGYSMEKRFVRKDGAVVHTILSTRLVRTPDGRPDHCLAQLQDVTERRRHDEEKARLAEQLRQAQKLEAIGRLAGGVAHDFNNLLTVQLGHLAVLREDAGLPPEARAAVVEIEKSARMATQLTRQLLAFGRRQLLQIERIDLNAVVENVAGMLRRVLPESIDLDVHLAPAPLWMDADRGSIEQVLMNLVTNARDATPRGGRIRVATTRESVGAGRLPGGAEARAGSFACLSVADTGQGMDADTRRRIFEPFFTTKDPGEGTGLGLATVYGIVTQSGGHVVLESAPGERTTFRLYWPRVEAAAPPAPSAPHAEGVARGHETILLVEDQPALRDLGARVLGSAGYRVVTASGGEEALRVLDAHRGQVDLLVTDVVMPGMSGRQLSQRVAADHPGVRVLFVSGYTDDAALRDGVVARTTHFIAKPYTVEALTRKVRQVLDDIA